MLVHILDFSESDSEYHLFCDECRKEIPDFLIQWESPTLIEGDCMGCYRKSMG